MSLTDTVSRPAAARDFFRPRRLGHTNLFVGDYLKAQQFYYQVAGFNEGYRQPDNLASFLSNGNSYHDLTLVDVKSHYNHGHCGPGMNHIAFELENEVDLADGWRRAKAAGVEFRCADHDVAHSLYTSDPDGNGVEFYADVVKDQREARKGIIIKQKPEYIPGVTSPAKTERFYPVNPTIDVVPEAMFHSRRCSHVLLTTGRFDEMFAYYRDIGGLRPFWSDARGTVAIFAGTHSLGDVTLVRQRGGQPIGMHHFGLEVHDEADLVAGAKKAGAAGLEIVREIDHPARHSLCIKDPDGLIVQFYANLDFRPERLNDVDEDTALYLL
jgi:catechol 2,3-dioxygenase